MSSQLGYAGHVLAQVRSSVVRLKGRKKRKKAIINIGTAILDMSVSRGTWPESMALHAEGKGFG